MSVSIYYTAKRIQPITLQEQIACQHIAKQYDTNYPFGELYEGFCIYDLVEFSSSFENEKHVIFAGATKLPPDISDMDIFGNIVNWWLECLHEIAAILPDAKWDVHIDDINIEFG